MNKPEQSTAGDVRWSRLYIFWSTTILLFAAVMVGTLFPQSRSWGFHFLAYYSAPVRWILIAGAAVLLSVGLRWYVRTQPPRLQPLTMDILLAVISGIIFFIFRTAVPVLGDGQLWINELNAGGMNIWTRRGPFTLGMFHFLYDGLYSGLPHGAQALFRDATAVLGAIMIFSWLRLARRLAVSPMIALLFGFTWGGIAQFFGYVELYSVMIVIVTVMIVWMVMSVHHQRPNWLVFVLAAIAPLFHLIAFTFWPAVGLYLWWCITKRTPSRRTLSTILLTFFGIAFAAYLSSGWYRGTEILLPILPMANNPYALFSGKHLLDLINEAVLVLGPGLGLLLLAVVNRPRDQAQPDQRYSILFLALAVPIAALIIHNPQLGMPRDWDIGAACWTALPIALIVIWSDLRLDPQSLRRIRLAFAAWIFVLIIPWIGIQVSEARSLARFTDLLRLDPSRSATGWDYLGAYYGRENNLRAIANCYEEALKYENNPRYHRELAVCYAGQREWPMAHAEADMVWKTVSADTIITPWEQKLIDIQPFMNAAGEFLLSGDFDNAHQMYQLASTLNPHSDVPDLALAGLLVCAGEITPAEDRLQTIIARDSTAITAVSRFFNILIHNENHPVEGWLGLGVLAKLQGNLDSAEVYVERSYRQSGGIKVIEEYLNGIRHKKRLSANRQKTTAN